jgi:glycerate 2-kinase
MLTGAHHARGGLAEVSFCAGLESVSLPNTLSLVGGHPHPTEASLQAGEELFQWIDRLPPDLPVWGMVSGGASAIVESFVPGWTLRDARNLTDQAFREGWPIERLNAERASKSRIKGGGLAKALGSRLKGVVLLSDVPVGQERWVGSGPFWLPETASMHRAIADRRYTAFQAVEVLRREGWKVDGSGEMSGDLDEWRDSEFIPRVKSLPRGGGWVWTGELTCRADGGGQGGRCQHLALSSLLELKGAVVFAVGTDGHDGPTPWAGALLDGTEGAALLESTASAKESWRKAVQTHDSSRWLSAQGWCLSEFKSGTNLNDLVMVVRP